MLFHFTVMYSDYSLKEQEGCEDRSCVILSSSSPRLVVEFFEVTLSFFV